MTISGDLLLFLEASIQHSQALGWRLTTLQMAYDWLQMGTIPVRDSTQYHQIFMELEFWIDNYDLDYPCQAILDAIYSGASETQAPSRPGTMNSALSAVKRFFENW